MLGQMMHSPLLVSSILRHASAYHGDTEVVSRTVEGSIHRYTYAELSGRAQKLANALGRLGLENGDRVGTLAWNGYRHMELYYGVSGSGLVCHTINPRLFPEQIAYLIAHAGDRILFSDLSFLPILEALAKTPLEQRVTLRVVMCHNSTELKKLQEPSVPPMTFLDSPRYSHKVEVASQSFLFT